MDVFPSTFSLYVTLVTAEKQNRCWKARAYTRAIEVDKQSEYMRRLRYAKARGGRMESIVI